MGGDGCIAREVSGPQPPRTRTVIDDMAGAAGSARQGRANMRIDRNVEPGVLVLPMPAL